MWHQLARGRTCSNLQAKSSEGSTTTGLQENGSPQSQFEWHFLCRVLGSYNCKMVHSSWGVNRKPTADGRFWLLLLLHGGGNWTALIAG